MNIGKILLVLSLFFISCDDGEPSDFNRDKGKMIAEISGDYSLNFESDILQLQQIRDSVLRFIYVAGQMNINDTLHILTTSRNNDTLLVGDYFETRINGNVAQYYQSNFYGLKERDLTYTDSTISGSFSFDAIGVDFNNRFTEDTINVRNGSFTFFK